MLKGCNSAISLLITSVSSAEHVKIMNIKKKNNDLRLDEIQ